MILREKLKKKVEQATTGAGVYIFLDKERRPLYIGRAINLRRRLGSYFRVDLDPAKKEMIDLSANVEIKGTDSFLEAVILEANLIKKNWPKYNIKDKDDRSFLYIVIPYNSYPLIVRGGELKKFNLKKIGKAKNKIFGPYQSFQLIRNFLKIIRRVFPYSDCFPATIHPTKNVADKKKLTKEYHRPCFNYQIGLCPGACAGVKNADKISQNNIKNIVLLLEGKKKRLMTKLKKEHPEKLFALQQIQDVALIQQSDNNINNYFGGRIEAYDISHFGGKETVGALSVFSGGEPDKKQYRLFKIKYSPQNDDLRALLEIVSRRFNHPEWPMPDIILIDGGRPQINFISKFLKEKNATGRLVGISKLSGDELVFPVGIRPEFKILCEVTKPILISARDEAHRFANNYRKNVFKKKVRA